MSQRRTQRKKYSDEYKKDAVRLMMARGSRTVGDIALELGVNESLLHKWYNRYNAELSGREILSKVVVGVGCSDQRIRSLLFPAQTQLSVISPRTSYPLRLLMCSLFDFSSAILYISQQSSLPNRDSVSSPHLKLRDLTWQVNYDQSPKHYCRLLPNSHLAKVLSKNAATFKVSRS